MYRIADFRMVSAFRNADSKSADCPAFTSRIAISRIKKVPSHEKTGLISVSNNLMNFS